jgi:hypothetical protein
MASDRPIGRPGTGRKAGVVENLVVQNREVPAAKVGDSVHDIRTDDSAILESPPNFSELGKGE